MEDFKEKFITLLMDKLSVSKDELRSDAKFVDLGADSLDMVELSIDFEKIFNITIPDEDLEKITTIGNAEEYIKNRINIP